MTSTDGMVADARKRVEPSWALAHERQYVPMPAPPPPLLIHDATVEDVLAWWASRQGGVRP